MAFTSISTALYSFFADFGVNAYRGQAEQSALFPYIVYNVQQTGFNQTLPFGFNVYTQSSSYSALNAILEKVEGKVPESGLIVPIVGGNIILYRGDPFVQDKTDEDPTIKAAYINLELQTNIDEK